MDRRDLSNLGDEIKDIVQNAVSTRDFHQLNRDIGNTVNSALDEVKRSIGINTGNWQNRNNSSWDNQNRDGLNQQYQNRDGQNPNNQYRSGQNWNNQNRGGQNWNNQSRGSWNNQTADNRNSGNQYGNPNGNYQNAGRQFRDRSSWDRQSWNRQPYRGQQTSYNAADRAQSRELRREERRDLRRQNNAPQVTKLTVPVGRIAGVVYSVLGNMGIGLFGIAILVLGILSSALHMVLFNFINMGLVPILAGSILMSVRGSTLRKRLKRYNQYVSMFRNRNYCTIKELTSNSGYSEKFIIKDLRKMIAIGMFPEGHIDEQKTCFMLNNESYDQYLKLQDNIRMQRMEEQQKKVTSEDVNEQKAESQNSELRKAIEEGKSYIRQIREANDAIPGEEISQKLFRLENVTGKIFDYVELHPDQLSEIQKFMAYYLPTTSKLLTAYKEFEMQPVQGENISSAKKEIENTLDTINLAFENLFDSLFQDAAMDISTDISVLQTMLAQEGLTEKDFSSIKQ